MRAISLYPVVSKDVHMKPYHDDTGLVSSLFRTLFG